MDRYVLVEGVPGRPMYGHPGARLGLTGATTVNRFAGWKRKSLSYEEMAAIKEFADTFEPTAEVLPLRHVAKGIKSGELKQIGKPVEAESRTEAIAKLKGSPAPALAKSDDDAPKAKAKAGGKK